MAKSAAKPSTGGGKNGALLETLRERFEKNSSRHKGISWQQVAQKLEASPAKVAALAAMETSGGEPDVVTLGKKATAICFVDCSAESPAGRRSVCYDQKALESRKEHRPKNSAMAMAKSMGVEILSEEEYRALQECGEFDLKTSSWILTPPGVRALGGALFCDRRYDQVFTYHNGAESYYAARGFRAVLRL
ncbi:DUF4256 domain-containing protein [Turneriella parva]|uniref:DUF4256 domain-containing protein n=1 Tax=Turneriella parva (strain ATCC BAA-1111 / DSM 21527 / NCTC 11395 / H) TaxID=869212 RepID=I4B485_TURPD|nr:DUF4256 domain-containing protein [Turneriella parva]AFM12092.1 hypothetical protein Turpa_1444 [Turneriella parva DSM 21527]